MKNLKGILFILIALCLVFVFAACNNGNFDLTKAFGGGGNGGGNEEEEEYIGDPTVPLTLEAIESGIITIKNPLGLVISYKKNSEALVTSTKGDDSNIEISVAAKDIVQLFGNNASYSGKTFDTSTNILCSADCYIYGNVMSLIDAENFPSLTELTETYTFYRLFINNTYIKNHADKYLMFPATKLTDYCYGSMFSNCTNLTEAPALPATTATEYCYGQMYYGCKSLVKAPKRLPAKTLAKFCYSSMFFGCERLTMAPELPATDLAQMCYMVMFGGCRSLTTAPALPAKTLEYSCYSNMFINCTSLTTPPALPAKKLASTCYFNMFAGCTFATAPELPAETMEEFCYGFMFTNCKNLTSPPALPAKNLASHCYQSMFAGCTFATAPELPATTLVYGCYKGMFANNSNLNSVKVHFTAWKEEGTESDEKDATENWLFNVATNGTFNCPSALTIPTERSASRLPENWVTAPF